MARRITGFASTVRALTSAHMSPDGTMTQAVVVMAVALLVAMLVIDRHTRT